MALIPRSVSLAAFAFLTSISLRPAMADQPWMSDKALLAAARAEGEVTIYSVTNEEEALPELQLFEKESGLKANYVRGGGADLMSRIMIETRANKPMWDVLASSGLELMPTEMLMDFMPPEAAHLAPGAMDTTKRWFGMYTIHYVPAYNTNKVKAADLPKSYEDFAKHPEWRDHVVIDSPPVMGLADAPLISSAVEAVVYVVESHGIRTSLVRTALARLQHASAHIVGGVLTKFEAKRAHYGYGYDYGYGYGRDDLAKSKGNAA